jgi:hypothetical protein
MRRLAVFIVILVATGAACAQAVKNPCPNAQPVPPKLRLPVNMPAGEPVEFEQDALKYLSSLNYRNLGWCHDKEVRDTGPLIQGTPAISHPAVHIYYSPEVSNWLLNGRKGQIPDGAVIIKEQFSPIPAARYAGIAEKDLGCSNDWTVMIKNSKASYDGWFWAELWNGSNATNSMKFDNPFQYPNAGYGIACLRCHSSAESQLTFSSLRNIAGGGGFPLQFRIDDSWRDQKAPPPPHECGAAPTLIDYLKKTALPSEIRTLTDEEAIEPALYPSHEQNAAIQEDVQAIKLAGKFLAEPPPPTDIKNLPPETYDTVLAPPFGRYGKSLGYVTSSQCEACHGGLANVGLGPTMVVTSSTSPTINVSEYGEWRWTPMGLAGRDPVFYSQLDSELAALKDRPVQQGVINTCEQCHGAMGKQTFAAEHPKEDFQLAFVNETNPNKEGFRYGGLARDGISCAVCHRIQAPKRPDPGYFFENQINGVYNLTPADELHGPFKNKEITTYPMKTGINVKPTYDDYVQNPQMCGSCHTIVLPVLDSKKKGDTKVEQATYPEWLNSDFRNEYNSVGKKAETCQECHMPTSYANAKTDVNVATLQTKIATVQDLTYPESDFIATPDDLDVRYHETGFRRHELLGTNGFLLQMFLKPVNDRKNNEVLGVRLADYMTGLTSDLQAVSDNVVQQAQTATATVQISRFEVQGNKLLVEVTVTNLVGHRFPSGVGFRRAFLNFEATANGTTFFASGRTDPTGQITDFAGNVLPTESFQGNKFQPHFDQTHPITSSSQVQIYEELVTDANGQITTSFTRRDNDLKDNRLLPSGWRKNGPPDLKIPEEFLEATWPVGGAMDDPVYMAGNGQSIVRYEIPLPDGANVQDLHATVTLFDQTLPPFYLADRYETKTPATARLQYLANSLGALSGTDYANWKLPVATASK